MNDFFKEIAEYNRHANGLVLNIFEANVGQISENSIRWFSHILNAHHVWNHRILGFPVSFGVWQIHDIAAMRSIDQDNFEKTLKIISEIDLTSPVPYETTDKRAYENTVRDILYHVINHSTYHRGQIANNLKINNIQPTSTDYIFYKR